jgi:glycogen operon protein
MRGLAQLRTVESWERAEGSPTPFGATWIESEQGWNFALFSRHATGLRLLLYAENDTEPVLEQRLDPVRNKSGPIWHCFVPQSAAPGARYFAWRAEGPQNPAQGQRFDPEKVLLDPFAEAVHFPKGFSREVASKPGPNDGRAPLGVLARSTGSFDWGKVRPPRQDYGSP